MANEEVMIDTPEGIRAYMSGLYRSPGVYVIRDSKGGMNMAVRGQGVIRSGSDSGEDKSFSMTDAGDQFVVQGHAPYAELTRLGDGWSAIATTAVAALVIRPTTVAAFGLWNGETAGGKSYVVDRIFSHNLVSTAAESFFGIWACLHPAGMTNPGEDIAASATNVTGNSGKTYAGLGVVYTGNETVVNNGWYPWGDGKAISASGVIPGSHSDVRVEGRLIIPPQGGLSIHVVASLTGCTFTSGLSWYEAQLALR